MAYCDIANVKKSTDTAQKQLRAIEYIKKTGFAEAVPQVSPNGKTFYCTFRTYQPGQTCLTCRVTRTDGSTAYQYCDITVVEPTEEQQTADSTQTDETAPVSPDAAAAE